MHFWHNMARSFCCKKKKSGGGGGWVRIIWGHHKRSCVPRHTRAVRKRGKEGWGGRKEKSRRQTTDPAPPSVTHKRLSVTHQPPLVTCQPPSVTQLPSVARRIHTHAYHGTDIPFNPILMVADAAIAPPRVAGGCMTACCLASVVAWVGFCALCCCMWYEYWSCVGTLAAPLGDHRFPLMDGSFSHVWQERRYAGRTSATPSKCRIRTG